MAESSMPDLCRGFLVSPGLSGSYDKRGIFWLVIFEYPLAVAALDGAERAIVVGKSLVFGIPVDVFGDETVQRGHARMER